MEATDTNPAAKATLHEDSLPSHETPDELYTNGFISLQVSFLQTNHFHDFRFAFIEDGCAAILHSASDFRAQGQLPYINMYR